MNNHFGPFDLLELYRQGVFPMADSRDDPRIMLIDPDYRGIIDLDNFHVARRLKRTMRNMNYEITINLDFRKIIEECAAFTQNRENTWINDKIIQLYDALHRQNNAYSIEVREDNQLIGGLYGVALGGAFFGESMFSRKSDTSKIALVHLVAALKYSGFKLLDAQFHNNHLEQFGLIEIPRNQFQIKLKEALQLNCQFPVSNFNDENSTPNLGNSITCLELLSR
jgi:leucyl/phenylalanyl-tRNA---protein transferase